MFKRSKAAAAAGLILVLGAGAASGAEFFLRAEQTALAMPDGRVVTMWGWAQDSAFGALDGTPSIPGPRLVIPPGDATLTIHVDNNLVRDPVSIVIPGLIAQMTPVRHGAAPYPQFDGRVRSFTQETAPGNAAAVTYTWTNLRPGTFIYHSGTHPSKQVQMGLYGCVTMDSAAGEAYAGPPAVAYDAEVVLFYSEIDPGMHDAIANGTYGPTGTVTSPIDYAPRYSLVNGQPYTASTLPIPAGAAGGRTLLRFVNAGLKSHAPQFPTTYVTVVAEDGFQLTHSDVRYGFTLEAMKTKDVILEPAAAGTYAVFDRALHLTNDMSGTGGFISHLDVTP